jgi:hypothetical protein
MIDTISYAEHLQREGDFTAKQAKVLALQRHEIEESMMTKAELANLATKQDLIELRQDVIELRSDLKLLKWGMALTIAVVLIPALKQLLML